MVAIDDRFDRQVEEIRMIREEMRDGFAALRAEISGMRREIGSEIRSVRAELGSEIGGLRAEIASVRSDLAAFQRQVTLIVAGFGVALLGLLGAGQL